MESIVRGLAVYLFVLIVFRFAGKRSLSEASSFDLVLLLIISETVQQALVDSDNSLTNALLLVLTLVGADVVLSVVKQRHPRVERLLDGVPVIVMKDGKLLHDRANRERIDEEDILEAAREQRGLERLDQIKFAVLERGGKITVIANDA
jgi:uncharacterized membrane protein YcaP (DUF421 family)